MKQNKLEFVKSAVLPKDFPPAKLPEVAICGRSNAGKSSFINGLSNQKLAKVSSTPGKTRLLNFFLVNEAYMLVDMPGYGFAARSNSEVEDWHKMIETYLRERSVLKGLLLVMDIRREWDKEEETMKRFSEALGFGMAVVLTKSDKIGRNQAASAVAKIKKASGLSAVFATSALEKAGQKNVEDYVFENWIKASDNNGEDLV